MTANDTNPRRPSAEEILAAAPPVRHEPAARERIRAAHAAAGRRIGVLDDDPTGSQTVHDVAVVTVFEDDEYAAGLAAPGSTCFILTNTRSLPEDTAVELNTGISASLFALGQSLGGPMDVVSRSDSTLRGHVVAEIAAIDAARRRVTGAGFDAVLLVPCFFEAGRFTAGDIHWANVSGQPIPAGDTEFAQDTTFGYRCGPSFPRALAGLEPQGPLTAAQIWPTGRPGGQGLVVVGSHVGLTSRQVAKAQERGGLTETELHVPTLLDPERRDDHVAAIGRQVAEALATSDVLLFTSRTLLRGGDADDSLAISRNVSTAVVEVVQAALAAHPAWVVGKGGITSHDVAVRGLGIRRAEVIGQLFPGMVSVFRPIEAAPQAVGTPYVVFAGNVGNDETLADVVDLFT